MAFLYQEFVPQAVVSALRFALASSKKNRHSSSFWCCAHCARTEKHNFQSSTNCRPVMPGPVRCFRHSHFRSHYRWRPRSLFRFEPLSPSNLNGCCWKRRYSVGNPSPLLRRRRLNVSSTKRAPRCAAIPDAPADTFAAHRLVHTLISAFTFCGCEERVATFNAQFV